MTDLYENAEGIRVTVLAKHATYHNGISEVSVVVYQGISILEDSIGVRVATVEVFENTFHRVNWDCGVDLYAILHQHLPKADASAVATEIENELSVLYGRRLVEKATPNDD